MTDRRPQVLFLCVHNAGRSQMAAAFLRRLGEGHVDVRSAGSEPTDRLNPAVVAALAEVGLDVSTERPKRLLDEMAESADVIITMGCGDNCPFIRTKQRIDWQIPDPKELPPEQFREVRDLIERKVKELLEGLHHN